MTNTLISKIAAASIKVGALKADKTNTVQGYDYISADKVLERAGDALAEVGVVIIPAITQEDTVKADYTDNYGKAKSRFDSIVHFMMTLTDGESQLEMTWRGRGSDFSVPDKALYKAITSGHKYFLTKLLNIGVGNEDGEHESHDDDQSATDAQPGAQPKQKVAPPVATKSAPTPVVTPPVAHRTAPRQPVPPTEEEVMGVGAEAAAADGDDNLPTSQERAIIKEWRGPTDAQIWAVQVGACVNSHEARNSWMKIVKDCGGYSDKMKAEVFLAFLRHQHEKLGQVAQP